MRLARYLVILLIPAALPGQERVTADSTAQAIADSVQVQAAADSSRVRREKAVVLPASVLHQNPGMVNRQPEFIFSTFHEDLAELLEHIPSQRLARTGDYGLPAQVAVRGELPRFTRLYFDRSRWPVGLHGQTELMLFPQIFVDEVSIDHPQESLRFRNAELARLRTWTYVEYVNGPFGSDNINIRVRRPFSKKFRAAVALTFSNSDGQENEDGSAAAATPFETGGLDVQFEYDIFAHYRLRYRLLNMGTEIEKAVPLYFEQLTADDVDMRKESRLFHGIEFSKPLAVMDTLLQSRDVDAWRVQLYGWDNREEFRSTNRTTFIQQRRIHAGAEAFWQFLKPQYRMSATARLENQDVRQSTIAAEQQWDAAVRADFATTLQKHLFARARLRWLYRERFSSYLDGSADVDYRWRSNTNISASYASRVIFPEPGEYGNVIPGVMAPAPSLQAMRLQQVRAGFRISRPSWEGSMYWRYSRIEQPFVLAWQDSLLQFGNAVQAQAYHSLDFSLTWRLRKNLNLKILTDDQIESMPRNYLFWRLPAQWLRVEAEFRHRVFEDLLVDVSLGGRYVSERLAPAFDFDSLSIAIEPQERFFLLDAMLKLYFKDAVIFLAGDNLLNYRGNWLPQRPIRDIRFRWGVNWLLWD